MQRFAEEEIGVGFKFDGMINAAHRLFAQPARRCGSRRRSWCSSTSRIRSATPSGRAWSRSPGGPGRRRRQAAGSRHALSLRRRAHRVLDRSRGQDEHLRALAAAIPTTCARAASPKAGTSFSPRRARSRPRATRSARIARSVSSARRARRRPSSSTVTPRRRWSTSARSRTCARSRSAARRPRTATARSAKAATATRTCYAELGGAPARRAAPASAAARLAGRRRTTAASRPASSCGSGGDGCGSCNG